MIRYARTIACCLASLTLIATSAETQRKRGGFQPDSEATPTPSKKKSKTTASPPPKSAVDEESATPAPKKKKKTNPETADKDEESQSKSTPKPKKERATTKEAGEPEDETRTKEKPATTKKTEDTRKPAEADASETAVAGEKPGILGPIVASLSPESLAEIRQQPEWLQRLIREALSLTQMNLGYLFGSADPQAGGMDCSGTIYYLLHRAGYKDVPRDSFGQYSWLQAKGTLRIIADDDVGNFDAKALRPGDLLFWAGTYQVDRELPISHVMLFLGTEKATGKPVMWGASDGRTYAGKQRYGVSVFDFRLPKVESKSKFVGFGQLPTPAKW